MEYIDELGKVKIKKEDLMKAAGVLALVGGTAATVATGGALAPALVGAASSVGKELIKKDIPGKIVQAGSSVLKLKAKEEAQKLAQESVSQLKTDNMKSIQPFQIQAISPPATQDNKTLYIVAGLVLIAIVFMLMSKRRKRR